MVSIRNNILAAIPIQLAAWGIILLSLAFEPFSWFLIPNVNNTPAFLTVSKWLAQSLLVTNIFGFCVYKIRSTNSKIFRADLHLSSLHFLISVIHIVIVGILIFLVAGFEDL